MRKARFFRYKYPIVLFFIFVSVHFEIKIFYCDKPCALAVFNRFAVRFDCLFVVLSYATAVFVAQSEIVVRNARIRTLDCFTEALYRFFFVFIISLLNYLCCI